MIFAGVARVRSLLAARLDMSILAVPSLKSVCRLYAGTGGFVTAMLAIRLMPAGYRGHKKASRTAPARRSRILLGLDQETRELMTPASGRCRPRGSRRSTG